jgi:hypothetical protein
MRVAKGMPRGDAMTLQWFTVIARYDDDPQTVADWARATTAQAAAEKVESERSGAFVLGVVEGRTKLAWTPEDDK